MQVDAHGLSERDYSVTYEGADGTVYGPISEAPRDSGSYVATARVENPNLVGEQKVSFAIAKAPQAITGPMSYSGVFGGPGIVLQNTAKTPVTFELVQDDGGDAPVSLQGCYATINAAGTARVIARAAESRNYLAADDVELTLSVAPAQLLVAVDDAERMEGESNPAFTSSLVSRANTGGVEVRYSCDADEKSPAGDYIITASVDDPNFVATIVPGTLTVKAKPEPDPGPGPVDPDNPEPGPVDPPNPPEPGPGPDPDNPDPGPGPDPDNPDPGPGPEPGPDNPDNPEPGPGPDNPDPGPDPGPGPGPEPGPGPSPDPGPDPVDPGNPDPGPGPVDPGKPDPGPEPGPSPDNPDNPDNPGNPDNPDTPTYKVVSGANSTFTAGGNGTIVMRADGDLAKFQALLVDGKELKRDTDYTVTSGSVIATIKNAYLSTLAAGKHTVTFRYNDGQATADFTVTKASDNGDKNDGNDNSGNNNDNSGNSNNDGNTNRPTSQVSDSTGANGSESNGNGSGSANASGTGSGSPDTSDGAQTASVALVMLLALMGLVVSRNRRIRVMK